MNSATKIKELEKRITKLEGKGAEVKVEPKLVAPEPKVAPKLNPEPK